jgi:hypothetical protein
MSALMLVQVMEELDRDTKNVTAEPISPDGAYSGQLGWMSEAFGAGVRQSVRVVGVGIYGARPVDQ